MKIVALDYSDTSIEVFNLPDDYFGKNPLEEDLTMPIEKFLNEHGHSYTETCWLVTDEKSIPVYYDGEQIPATSL